MRSLASGNGETIANALHAVRVSDGQLLPIAIFPSDFTIAAL